MLIIRESYVAAAQPFSCPMHEVDKLLLPMVGLVICMLNGTPKPTRDFAPLGKVTCINPARC